MTEVGFPPPDGPKKQSLKSKLLSSTAPLPEQVHTNPFAATEAPPLPDDEELEFQRRKEETERNTERIAAWREAYDAHLREPLLEAVPSGTEEENLRREPTFDPTAPVSPEEAVRIMTDWNERDVASEDELIHTDVHIENVSRFKSFMKVAARMDALSAKAKELGPQTEKIARRLGAEYNKLNWKQKIAVGVGLVGVAAVGTALTGGGGLLWSLGATGWWRVLSGSGTFVALDGVLNKAKEVKGERWWNKHAKAYAVIAGVIVGGASLAIATGEAIVHSGWLADMLGHGHHAAAAVPHAGVHGPAPAAGAGQEAAKVVAPATAEHVTLPAAEHATNTAPAPAEPVAPAAAAAPETAAQLSVEIAKGHGYEQGVWELWQHMHDPSQHFTLPPNTAPESDLARLYHADQHTIGGLAHRLAIKHEFFRPGAAMPNDRIAEHSLFSFSGNGDVQVEAPGHEAIAFPTDHTGATPAFHSDVVPGHEHAAPAAHPEPHQPTTEELNQQELTRVRAKLGIEQSAPTENPAAPAPTPEAPASTLSPLEAYHHGDTIQSYPLPPSAESAVSATEVAPSLGHFASAAEYAQAHLSEAHVYGGGGKEFFVLGSNPNSQANAIAQFFTDPHHARSVIYGTDASGQYRIPYVLGADGKIMPGLPIRTRGFFGFFSSWMKAPSPADVKTLIQ